jgi:hypothetical protein
MEGKKEEREEGKKETTALKASKKPFQESGCFKFDPKKIIGESKKYQIFKNELLFTL